MSFKQFLTENTIARTKALKNQQVLIDDGYNVEVKKYVDLYQLKYWPKHRTNLKFSISFCFCLPDGRVVEHMVGIDEILTDASSAYDFAFGVIKGPWPLAEGVIATQASPALDYARYVLKGPWPPGEDSISQFPSSAYFYALEVLKGPFPAGEKSIAENPSYAYNYAFEILKGPFPAGEPAIAKSAHYSFLYAINALKGPFPAGERAIMLMSEIQRQYLQFLKAK